MKTREAAGRQKQGLISGIVSVLLFLHTFIYYGQQTYDTFEGGRLVHYFTPKNWGKLDTLSPNPDPGPVNMSSVCAMYTRSRQRYDYIKVYPGVNMLNVDKYTSYEQGAPKMKLKVYTNAPAGALVEIQLGKQTGNAYPQGTHSQFQAFTTVTGAWEELEFKFAQRPQGSETRSKDVDHMTLLFMPGTNKTYTFYFDDLTGPDLDQEQNTKSARKKNKNARKP